MVISKISGNIKDCRLEDKKVDIVWIEWFEQEKKLLRKTSEQGEELGLQLDKPIGDGDILYQDDQRAIVAKVMPTHLTEVAVKSMKEMGKLCFEIGNRHISLKIEENRVMLPYDEPTFTYLKKLGFDVVEKRDQFTEYTVCHAHGGSHGHAHIHT